MVIDHIPLHPVTIVDMTVMDLEEEARRVVFEAATMAKAPGTAITMAITAAKWVWLQLIKVEGDKSSVLGARVLSILVDNTAATADQSYIMVSCAMTRALL